MASDDVAWAKIAQAVQILKESLGYVVGQRDPARQQRRQRAGDIGAGDAENGNSSS